MTSFLVLGIQVQLEKGFKCIFSLNGFGLAQFMHKEVFELPQPHEADSILIQII